MAIPHTSGRRRCAAVAHNVDRCTEPHCSAATELQPHTLLEGPAITWLFWESEFIDQAAPNGTRPNAPAGAKPAATLIKRALLRQQRFKWEPTLTVDPPALPKPAASAWFESVASAISTERFELGLSDGPSCSRPRASEPKAPGPQPSRRCGSTGPEQTGSPARSF